ncbi:hypothetical protein H7849_12285 [Alloacidobacterium dinghuense]|uniref:Uncharacterized protein n=1 Tax=Alloacidobacterium dinghuense TaxID=2763107 RepID=A0A7G8BPY0_9BACT|nr:hypothetical protein [Alloacidobacterium dinghuense]QNI34600.1 hypothetical protein H7849_12285 [Alloacidobacterium dinghuense]
MPKPDEQTSKLAGAVKLLWGKNVFKVRLQMQGVNRWDEYGSNRDEYGRNRSASGCLNVDVPWAKPSYHSSQGSEHLNIVGGCSFCNSVQLGVTQYVFRHMLEHCFEGSHHDHAKKKVQELQGGSHQDSHDGSRAC